MTPEEQQKADAWMLLKDSDAVRTRILDVVQAAFDQREVMSWIAGKLIDAEKNSLRTPLKAYFEDQLQRNLRLILADGVAHHVERMMQPMLDEAVKRHAEQVSKDLAELKKLKSKGPIHGKR
jgi:hypothetical protein